MNSLSIAAAATATFASMAIVTITHSASNNNLIIDPQQQQQQPPQEQIEQHGPNPNINDNNDHESVNPAEHMFGDLLPNSCENLADGEHWFLLSISENNNDDNNNDISEFYKPVKLMCNNGYIILDVKRDSNLLSYFSTFEMWHYAIGGPSNNNPVTWEDWFLPNDNNNNAQYLISPDCNVCDNDYAGQVYDSKTTYWMTGNLAKLHWPVIGFNECDMDYDTYQCYDCTSCMAITVGCEPTAFEIDETDYTHSGICGVTVQESTHEIYNERHIAQRASGMINYKPSIGTNGEFCVCYQPDISTKYSLTDEQENIIELRSGHLNSIYNANNGGVSQYQNNENSDMMDINDHKPAVIPSNGEEIGKLGLARPHSPEEAGADDAAYDDLDNTNVESVDLRDSNIVYLTQNDFLFGTYRIRESGTYIISENIIFDFNKDDDYWPRSDQINEYPGAAQYRDPYHMGFFAGIAIETDYVTIDLNNYELKQSLEFYYQQRWFAIIELGNQQFLPGQGPAFFGPDPLTISNIVIKNGVLGRTSHFGIHGNFPTGLTVENVHIRDFVTHGLQLNGWNHLIMNNIEVGPSSTIEYLRGDYGHARIVIQRLRAIENDMINDGTIDTKTVTFSGREDEGAMTITDIADNLELQMELAYNYALNRANGGLYEYNDYIDPKYTRDVDGKKLWSAAKTQFVHESGLPSASSITGLFLNFEGASVFSYTMYTTRQSKYGSLNNIYIHDIYHDMVESMRISRRNEGGQLYPTPWNSDIPAEHMFGGKDKLYSFHEKAGEIYESKKLSNSFMSNMKIPKERLNDFVNSDSSNGDKELFEYGYAGSVMSDAYFSMGVFSDDWGYLGFLEIATDDDDTALSDWAFDNAYATSDWVFGCNQDIMGHSGKGLLGLRIDGVSNVELDNIRIENLHQYTPLGSYACGNYYRFTPEESGGHFKQSEPMQWGFSSNDLQAVSIISSTDLTIGNLNINNIKNDYSQSYGLSFWTGNNINFKDDALVMIKDVRAGIKLESKSLAYDDKPNRAPEACAVRLEIDDTSDYYQSYINTNDELNGASNIIACNIDGHVTCLGIDDNERSEENKDKYTMYGRHYIESTQCDLIREFNDLTQLNVDLKLAQDQPQLQPQPQIQLQSKIVTHNRNENENEKTHKDATSDNIISEKVSVSAKLDENNSLSNAAYLISIGLAAALTTIIILYCYYKYYQTMDNTNNNKYQEALYRSMPAAEYGSI